MTRAIRQFFIAILFLFLFSSTAFAFSDVSQGSKYFEGAQFLEQKGVLSGETFEPQNLVKKADFVKWLLLSSGFNPSDYEIKTKIYFSDVGIDSELAPYVYFLVDNGVIRISSSSSLFGPQRTVSIIDALKMTFAVNGVPVPLIFKKELWTFSYLRFDAWFSPYFYKANTFGMLPSRKLYPTTPILRGEAANLLKKAEETASANGQNVQTIFISIGNGANNEIAQSAKFPILNDAWSRIRKNYIKRDQLNDDELMYGTVEGLVKELKDQYSEFLRPNQNAVIESLSGEIEGIGAYIQSDEEERIIIVSPIRGSPAEDAGLLPYDVILEVNGEKLQGLSVSQAAAKIRGPAGTEVKLKIQRNGRIFEVTIIRDHLSVPSVELSFTEDNIAVIKLNNFGQNTNLEFMKALVGINNKNPKGLILDLRNNPGGFLDTAVMLAGYFIEQGRVVVKVEYPDRVDTYASEGSAVLAKYPLRVLINKGSASASEIIAGALKDYGIGKIIGEKSFGKGTVQELTDFSDGSALKITVAKWLTPNGNIIEEAGITPDIIVTRTEDDIKNNRDPQLDRALTDLR